MTRVNIPSDANSNQVASEYGNRNVKRDYTKSIDDIRSQVKCHFTGNPDLYDPDDLKKVFNIGFYVSRFLHWCRGDVKKSVQMILKCFQWRKSSGLIYRKPSDFPSEFYSTGGMFRYQPDRTGRPVLYMRARFIRKIAELDDPLKDFIAYKINEIDQDCGKIMSWTIVFDCAEVGWANVHIEMLRYLITTMSNYFPFGVRRIIVLDIPWILDKIRKMVFAMMPEEAQKVVIFTTRKDLFNLIAPENVPDFAGGTCTLPYNQVPPGSKPFDQLSNNFYNLTQKQLDKLTDLYKSLSS